MNYFEDPSSKRFSFSSQAMGLAEDTFAVIQFKGYEALSKPYEFEILLVSSIIDINLDDVLQSSAVFTIHRGENDDVIYNGIMAEFEQLNEFNGYVYYKARLVPKLWWLTLTKHNQVFLDQTVSEFFELALRDGGLETEDFDFAGLEYSYEPLEYVCQYGESHYSFISRWMEREGIYYYFSQDTSGEQVMFTDSSFSHEPLNQGADLYYSPPTGLESTHLTEIVRNFTCRQKQLPAEVVLKDHNYERPSLNNEGRAEVDPMGRGISYVYGEHFSTPEEGERLAAIRAEELLCQKQEFYGESTVPFMEPGYKFNLLEHYREDFNNEYLITEVTHEGYQGSLLSSGIAGGIAEINNQNTYINSFKAIPGDVQYRPEVNTAKPKISGTLHAVIDGEVDSEYAQLDEEGRYKVRLPFDVNDDHIDGKASARVRMMQPYAGENRGMQFPMSKGTEVLLTFIDGNPDRPMIAGAVNNPAAPGPVTADNQTESVIATGSNNRIRFEDQAGSERIIMESPTANSWVRIGAPNDPVNLDGQGDDEIEYAANGIRIKSDGSLWHEALDKYGDFVAGSRNDASTDSSDFDYTLNASIQTMLDNFGASYAPTGIRPRYDGDPDNNANDFTSVLNKARVMVSSLDTVTTQEGNIYDFGGYWNYNLGNSYAEDHIFQNPELNVKHSVTWPEDKYNKTGAIVGGTFGTVAAMAIPPVVAAGLTPNAASTGGAVAAGIVSAVVAGVMVDFSTGLADSDFQEEVGDVLGDSSDNSGPGRAGEDGTIKTWANKVGSSFQNADPDTGQPTDSSGSRTSPDAFLTGEDAKAAKGKKGPMHTDSTWVQKSFGDSYSFTKGNTIEITHGHTESHYKGDQFEFQYGGNRESTTVTGEGIKTVWERSGGGSSEEVHWDPATGQFVSYEYKNHGHFAFSVTIPTIPSLSLDLSMSSLKASGSVSAGTSINFEASASMSINAKLTAGLSMDLTRTVGGSLVMDESTGYGGLAKVEFKTVGFAAENEASVKAEKKNVELIKTVTKIQNGELRVENGKIQVSKNNIWADATDFKFF